MSSIALFYNNFTGEEKLKKQLAAATGYRLCTDNDLLMATGKTLHLEYSRVERAVFGTKSVFNQFTLEKERVMAQLRLLLVKELDVGDVLLCGFCALLVPASITDVLRVGIFGEPVHRIQRAIQEGVSEKNAIKLVKKNDALAFDWGKNLYGKSIRDASLYDIVIPAADMTEQQMAQLVLEHYHRPVMLTTDVSRRALKDFSLQTQAEVLLVEKGYTPSIVCKDGNMTLRVNKASFNFSKLRQTMRDIVLQISGVKSVEILASRDSVVSIYRDQDFTPPPKVLLVDDEQEFVQTLSERLISRQYGSYPVFDGEQALDCLKTDTPDVMVLDLKMPGMEGIEVLEKVKEMRPAIEVIILTGHGSEDDRNSCMKLGAFAYLRKPVDIKELTSVIDEAYKKIASDKLEKLQ